MEQARENKVFRIGIAMAGAVSAGAYTGGVIDYLLETLQRWEDAKKSIRQKIAEGTPLSEKEKSVPLHDVVIEVLGGASAGGMTTAIATMAIFNGITHINAANPEKKNNKLYDSWVNLNDNEEEGPTLIQMCQYEDTLGVKIPSLLNSKPIDKIADRASQIEVTRDIHLDNWPSYISKDLELILTICTLRGIPVEIDFGKANPFKTEEKKDKVPAHKMHMHKGIAHFTINPGRLHEQHLLPFNPNEPDSIYMVIEAAKATGAFPVGLAPRFIQGIDQSYIMAHLRRSFGNENININEDKIPENFNFTAVDGGTINNEPFDEVLKVLEERHEQEQSRGLEGIDYKNFALLMIDPFPNFEEDEYTGEYEHRDTIGKVIPDIFSAIRRQAMMKESELTKGFIGDHTRSMVFPVKRVVVKDKNGIPLKDDNDEIIKAKLPYPIACGALDGFGGFFSKEFRHHDFMLGRKNCQAFLRKHFSMAQSDVYQYDNNGNKTKLNCPIFEDWNEEHPACQRFAYNKHGQLHFPFIPDLRVLDANSDDPEKNGSFPEPELQKITSEELKTLRRPIKVRFNRLIWVLIQQMLRSLVSRKETDPDKKIVNKYVNRRLGTAWIISAFRWLFGNFIILLLVLLSPLLLVITFFGIRLMVIRITNMTLRAIVSDFRKRDIIEELEKK